MGGGPHSSGRGSLRCYSDPRVQTSLDTCLEPRGLCGVSLGRGGELRALDGETSEWWVEQIQGQIHGLKAESSSACLPSVAPFQGPRLPVLL